MDTRMPPPVPPLDWWRCAPLWLVLGALLSAIVASSTVAVLAFRQADHELAQTALQRTDRARVLRQVTAPVAPALQGRNHAATPRP